MKVWIKWSHLAHGFKYPLCDDGSHFVSPLPSPNCRLPIRYFHLGICLLESQTQQVWVCQEVGTKVGLKVQSHLLGRIPVRKKWGGFAGGEGETSRRLEELLDCDAGLTHVGTEGRKEVGWEVTDFGAVLRKFLQGCWGVLEPELLWEEYCISPE